MNIDDQSQFYDALAAVERSPEMVLVQTNDYSRYNRYTTRAMIQTEQMLMIDAGDLAVQRSHPIENRFIEQAIVHRTLTDEQANVLRQTAAAGDLHVIIGHAGTGKTYTMGAIKDVYEASGYKLQGVALAGVAAKGLQRETGIESTSIHKKVFEWDRGGHRLDSRERSHH